MLPQGVTAFRMAKGIECGGEATVNGVGQSDGFDKASAQDGKA